jgi:uncharacterized protein (TIGR03067 family)
MIEEIEKLQGTWRIVSLEVEGSKMEEALFTGSKVMVAGEAFSTLSMGAGYGGLFAIDATSDPYKLDMIFTYGPHAGARSLGIYRFDGDTWILCLGMAGRERPEDFVTKPGSGHALEKLEREPEPKPEPPSEPQSETAPLQV